jgi:hypothetical protein
VDGKLRSRAGTLIGEVVTAVRGTLRRLSSAPGIHDDEALHDALLQMRRYLKLIIKEYQAKYLPVARQQRLDEAVLSFRLGELAKSEEAAFPAPPRRTRQATARRTRTRGRSSLSLLE